MNIESSFQIASLESQSDQINANINQARKTEYEHMMMGRTHLTHGMYDRLYLKTERYNGGHKLPSTIFFYIFLWWTHQANDKTCKMQNSNASPKFFHWKKKKETLWKVDISLSGHTLIIFIIIIIAQTWITHPEGSTESQNKASLKRH